MFLSKRWRFVWTMLPKLDYTKSNRRGYRKICGWDFIDKSLQLHKAPSLELLSIQINHQKCPVDFDIGKWVDRCVRELILRINFIPTTANPTSLPKSLYSSKALVKLSLSGRFLVDVPSPACLPSLKSLVLKFVVYKDQDSHVKLLSGCPVLRYLYVLRDNHCNVTRFSVKVPSLEKLEYVDRSFFHNDKRLVIDCPRLNYLYNSGSFRDGFLIKNMPRLDVAKVLRYGYHPNEEFLTSLSSVRFLVLGPIKVAVFSAINFSRLINFTLRIHCLDNWLEPLMLLLHKAPKLKALKITSVEDFRWKGFGGRRAEKKFLAYILANSNCLKTVRISLRPYKADEVKKKIMELESMYRVSTSAQVQFYA
ncbi:PREDICTED: putative F-box/FBD/LRR-repeat protein At1g22000 [Camelina sativa]|uniref:F-box/FBD/LRR-repeat protein At1g22000 n=1 Tax=Camelina sativa TaxID=90675 RepID=A0ABM1QZI1_CAMSA|nr:PREDICTED: putative F-box/FBD/LRR-repeat protein At1g22000 [Camelina sativa]